MPAFIQQIALICCHSAVKANLQYRKYLLGYPENSYSMTAGATTPHQNNSNCIACVLLVKAARSSNMPLPNLACMVFSAASQLGCLQSIAKACATACRRSHVLF